MPGQELGAGVGRWGVARQAPASGSAGPSGVSAGCGQARRLRACRQAGRGTQGHCRSVIPSAPGVPRGNSDFSLSTDGQEILLLGYSNPK